MVDPSLISAGALRASFMPLTVMVLSPILTTATFPSLAKVAVFVALFQFAVRPRDSPRALTGSMVKPVPLMYGAVTRVFGAPLDR